jgi:hypothetical protein
MRRRRDPFQRHPAQRGRALEAQLRRYIGGRNIHWGLDLERGPRSLDRVLAHVAAR